MTINGWEYNFKSLKFWKDERKEEIFFREKGDILVVFYSWDEFRMACYHGYVAILKCKDNPKLVFNTKFRSDYNYFSDPDDDCIRVNDGLVILMMIIPFNYNYDYSNVCIIDLNEENFSFLKKRDFARYTEEKNIDNFKYKIRFKSSVFPIKYMYFINCLFTLLRNCFRKCLKRKDNKEIR